MFRNTEELLKHLDLAGWSEGRRIELKPGQEWDVLEPELVKGALALSNTEGGGHIVIGVRRGKDATAHAPECMPKETAQTYDQDRVSDRINAFADPHIDVKVRHFEHDGGFFVVIGVPEFSAEPVVCKKGNDAVRPGVLYCRSRGMPQSSPVASSAEMRAIIDRAVDKAFARQSDRLRSYPLQPSGRFEEEQGEESASKAKEVMETVRERGHWEIRIRPAAYPNTPHDLTALENALQKSRVEYRGLSYPYISRQHGELYRLDGCIESWFRWAEFAGVLRLYASGQFVHHMAMSEDLLDDFRFTIAWDALRRTPPPPTRPFLYPVSALYYLTEVYLFASKIAREGILGDNIVIETTLHGQKGRTLKYEAPQPVPVEYDGCRYPEIRLGPHRVTAGELRAHHDGMAVRDAAILMEKYGIVEDSLEETLRGWQANFYKGSP